MPTRTKRVGSAMQMARHLAAASVCCPAARRVTCSVTWLMTAEGTFLVTATRRDTTNVFLLQAHLHSKLQHKVCQILLPLLYTTHRKR